MKKTGIAALILKIHNDNPHHTNRIENKLSSRNLYLGPIILKY